MPKIINRAPKTPRKIRDIRPKRQLSRNNEKKQEQEHDDDCWYHASSDGGEEQARLRGVAAVHRIRRPLDTNVTRNSEPNLQEENNDRRRNRIFAILRHVYESIRQAPREQRRKRLFWGLILITAWKAIYFVDLDQYSRTNMESNAKGSSSLPFMTPMDDEFSSLKEFTDDTPSSMFGEAQPKLDFSSSSMTTGLRSSGISGSMGQNMLERETTGMKSTSQFSRSDSILSPFQRKSRSMIDSSRLGGNDYPASRENSNSMSRSDSIFPPFQQKSSSMVDSIRLGGNDYSASRENSNSMQSHAFSDLYPSSKMEAKTSQLAGSQTQISWTNSQKQGQNQQQLYSPYQEPQKDSQHLPEYSNGKGLRGQNSLGNPQSMSGSDYDSESFQIPVKYQQPVDNSQSLSRSGYDINRGGNDFNMNKDTAFQDNMKMPFTPLGGIGNSQFPNNQNNIIEDQNNQRHMAVHGHAAGLDCAGHGGPFLESEYADIVYWRDIPSDASFTSPYYNPQAQEAVSTSFWKAKYLTFEMDDAGWNNMRLGLENVMVLAHSMGRTLVMPPKRQIAHGLLDKSGSKVVSFGDFYDIDAINAKQKGLNIITMDKFLEREARNGQLKSKVDGAVIYSPNNQIMWDNQRLDPLWKYIRNVTKSFHWNPKECVLAFPAAGSDDQHVFSMMADVLVGKDGRSFPHFSEYQGRPVNVDAPPIERFRENLAGRRQICMYDRKMHEDNPVVHFKADQIDGTRLITQFYAFLWFEDWRHDLWSKRFVRDNLRYNNEIMCLSARIISALRNHARQRSPGNVNGIYDAVHIRRGDFQQQFPMTMMDASEILAGLKEHIAPGSTLFICTNERDISFFRPIQEVYDVSFLGDFGKMLSDINPNYFPLVEQIVASRGRLFFGTMFSTFSAYITRLRGYYSVLEKHDGHINGGLRNTYFLPTQFKNEMRLYQAIHKPLYGRDFPVAWRDIDR